MAKICVRRHSDHYFVHAIREAIQKISQQKQCPNEERIVRSVLQEFDWTKHQVMEQLSFAAKDGLVTRVTTTSNHGRTKGIPQTAYRVFLRDSDENEKEELEARKKLRTQQTHDWYCWKCHGAGEVLLCDYCPKVFHKECSESGTVNNGKLKCPSCQPQELSLVLSKLSSEDLSQMLKFTLERMKEKANEFLRPFNMEEHYDYNEFVFKPMDLTTLEKLVDKKQFKSPKEFREETWWILHNAVVYFGDDDELTDLAEAIIEDCGGELEELERCPDCYMMSNTRVKDWFCKPCYFPHELVWAKMSGEPPWPAKLLSWNEDKMKALVRFFGIAHQRAWVASRNITAIENKPDVKKRPQRWLQAQEEMKDYQRQLHVLHPETRPRQQVVIAKKCFKESQAETPVREETNRINELTLKIKKLENDLKASKSELEIERRKSKDLRDSVQRKEEEKNQRVLRTKSVVAQIPENNVDRGRSDSSGLVLTGEPALLIKNLQDTIERERQEKKELAEKITRETQKGKEKECQQLVKRAVNKERLERERIVEEEVQKAVEKVKAESKRTLQRALFSAKQEAERSQQALIASMKGKQWCVNCGKEAYYPCCWNTSYCTLSCQQSHWLSHKFNCVRSSCNCTRENTQR